MSLMLLDCRILIAGGLEPLDKHERGQFIRAHNYARAKEGLEPVRWNDYLAKQAKSWASHLSRTCMAYPSGQTFGENISLEWGVFPTNPHLVVKKWIYRERHGILWHETKFIGCGKSSCIDSHSLSRATIFVCHYFPRERLDDEIIFIPKLDF
jgi:hypothetical protein